jgi:ATP-dependent helicase/nuclease subunit B
LPVFLHRFCRDTSLTATEVASCGERLISEKLCETLDDAAERLQAKVNACDPQLREFVQALQKLAEKPVFGRELLAQFYNIEEEADATTALELGVMVEALDESTNSPLLTDFSPAWREILHRSQLAECRVFSPAPDGAVEIQGWLEASWSNAPVVCVAGCREGALPSGGGEDAFLPDSLRRKLSLPTRDSLFARDAYLLSCLLHYHGSGRLRLGFSRFRPGGEPNRPSRLLLGCPDQELPERVEKLFQPLPPHRSVLSRSLWKLHLPPPAPVESIRVTGFKSYLACPLRFYLSQVLRLSPFEISAREISAADFGTLMHRVLENFHKKGPAENDDERVIASFLENELNSLGAATYGRHPLPAVRVQIESMRARLRHFAVLQSTERREGWSIIESEFFVKKDAGFKVGPLALAGTMDRVEVHPEQGLRILDYKTFGRPKSPEETHFGAPRILTNLPEAEVERPGKNGKLLEKSWLDLQLPLYRRLAREIWPQPAEQGLATGYILLPGDPDDTGIALLNLDDETQNRAERCAEAITSLIGCGVFWPPETTVDYDNFASWFDGEDPALFFDDATIAALEGRP